MWRKRPSSSATSALVRDAASSHSSLAEISAQFGLTQREGEAVEFLLQGLTTKEIATRMQISPQHGKSLRSIGHGQNEGFDTFWNCREICRIGGRMFPSNRPANRLASYTIAGNIWRRDNHRRVKRIPLTARGASLDSGTKRLWNSQGLFVDFRHGDGHAQAAGEARRFVDRAHGVGLGSGASVLSAFE